MWDFFHFRRMVTPILLQALFWLMLIYCLVLGILDLYGGYIKQALLVLFLGPIIMRILFEILILFFRINETLTDIRCNTAPKISTILDLIQDSTSQEEEKPGDV